jgi:uncharacterized membrane protein YdbT with pleckstrin-like domain
VDNENRAVTDTTLWKARSSQWLNVKTYLFAVLGFWLVLPLFYAVARYLDVRFRLFELTAERLRVSQGVLSKRIDELELFRVKDLSVDRPLSLRLFGLGTLVLHTSDHTNPVLAIPAIADYESLLARIRQLVGEQRQARRVREVDFT